LGAHYTYVPEGVGGDKNVVMLVRGAPANAIIAFSYLLIIIYALTLAPICWVYAAEVWSLETRAWGMGISYVTTTAAGTVLKLIDEGRLVIGCSTSPLAYLYHLLSSTSSGGCS